MFSLPNLLAKGKAGLSLSLLVSLILSGCSSFSQLQGRSGESSVRVEPVTGRYRLSKGPQTEALSASRSLSPGDKVRVAEGDVARVVAGPGRTLEVWGGNVEMLSKSRFRLLSGQVLVQNSSPITVQAGELRVSGTKGAFRLDKQLATRVANYAGRPVSVKSSSEELRLPAYRQLVTVQGVLPRAAQALRFSASDRWDRRFLSPAIDLDVRISNFAQGLEAQLGSRNGLDFFSKVAPGGISVDFLRPYLTQRSADLLIGLTMSAEADKLSNLPPEMRFNRIFRLWNEGASWGLLAQEFGVDSNSLFSRLTDAISRAQIQLIGPGPGLVRAPAPLARAPVRRPRAPAGSRAGPQGGSASTAPAPAPSRPGVLPPAVNAAVPDPVEDVVDDLLGVVDPDTKLPPLL